MINRRNVLLNGALGVAATLATGPLSAQKRPKSGELPNILWFVSEDNFPVIGAYGDTLARTPTIDALARRGVLYNHNYCTSPVCGTSRFSILTGIHAASAGSAQNFGSTDEVLPGYIRGYPQYLKDLGYYTANNQKKNYNCQFDYVMDMWDESGEQAHWNKRAPGQPFFSIFNTFTTHESCLFRNVGGLKGKVTPDMVGQKIPKYLPDTDGVRKDITTFYNAMEKMDGEFAARLAEIEAAGLSDDTIVFYYSDNGGITPRGKRYCYDLGLRCPLIIYVPPKWAHLMPHAPGTVIEEPTTFNDLLPTILSIVGIKPPAHVHGRALLGPYKSAAQKYAMGHRNRMDERYDLVRTITDTRYRYIRNYAPHRPWGQHTAFMMQASSYQDWEAMHLAGQLTPVQDQFWGTKPYEELYDVQTDPDMVVNLAGNPAYAAKHRELSNALDAYMIEINDNAFIPEACAAEGYVNSRQPDLYPLREAMALAAKAASRDAKAMPEFLSALKHPNEVIRYWGAQGLLIAGPAALPHAAAMKAAMLDERSVATRIALCEALVKLTDDRDALITLGVTIEIEDDDPLQLQAINAIDFVGEKARPILPAIRRAAKRNRGDNAKVADYILEKLDGSYDPYKTKPSPGGGVIVRPDKDMAPGSARPIE